MQPAIVPDPLSALAWFAAVCAVVAVFIWPRRGIIPRTMTIGRVTNRVRIEDALKQLHRSEYEGTPATIESVAGALQISRVAAARLLSRLEEMQLVDAAKPGFALTAEGRAYALRVLRTHRLWERYLADRTGVRAEEWHDEAEHAEHTLSADATDRLATALGHPLYDPHGDPIPTATGDIPSKRGVDLTSLRPGDAAVITHLEDEPGEIYGHLIAEHLAPQMTLQVLESAPGEVRVRTARGDRVLPSVAARNVTVEPLPAAMAQPGAYLSLADAQPGDEMRVVGISPACEGAERRRLLDLGIVAGTVIRAELRGAAGEPIAYRVRGSLIALRREQASRVQVERNRLRNAG
jgi:DtxR family Mn-dependent transcriptional regulator